MTEVKFNESIDLHVERAKNPNARKNNRNNKPYVKTDADVKAQVVKALENVGGKYVSFDDEDHTEGLLVAGVINNDVKSAKPTDKYCFAIVNKDRKVMYMNSNEHFSVLHNVPSSLFVLDYLYHREAATIANIVSFALNEQDNVEVITDVHVFVPKNNGKKNNKSKKNNKKK